MRNTSYGRNSISFVFFLFSVIATFGLIISYNEAFAAKATVSPLTGGDYLSFIKDDIQEGLKLWEKDILNVAKKVFVTLATISLSWTFGLMLLRKADLQEFFGELLKFILFFGFLFWLLIYAPDLTKIIKEGFVELGKPYTSSLNIPNQVIDKGFLIFKRASIAITWPNAKLQEYMKSCIPGCCGGDGGCIKGTSYNKWYTCYNSCYKEVEKEHPEWTGKDMPFMNVVKIGIAILCLLLLCYTGINMFIVFIINYFLYSVGVILLGFGGSRWTSDMAINYYKIVAAAGMQYVCMSLIASVCDDVLSVVMNSTKEDFLISESWIVVFVCVILFMLSKKIPRIIGNIVTGGDNFAISSNVATTNYIKTSVDILKDGLFSIANDLALIRNQTQSTSSDVNNRTRIHSVLPMDNYNIDTSVNYNTHVEANLTTKINDVKIDSLLKKED